MFDWFRRKFPHWTAHALVTIAVGAAVYTLLIYGSYPQYAPFGAFVGLVYYLPREVIQYRQGKRWRGGFDWPGFISPIIAAGGLFAVLTL